jgi:NCS1 family nucleobase:cation symporter-1
MELDGGLIEKRSIDYVPLAERHGKVWHLWPVWFSGDAHLATVATGVVGIALGGNLVWMAFAVVFGGAFGTFFMAFHSTQGPQLGLPQMIQSRPQFGYVGALLVWGVALIAYIGFNAFNQILAAQTLHSLYGAERRRRCLVFALLSVSLAVVGYDLIHLAQRWIAYLLIVAHCWCSPWPYWRRRACRRRNSPSRFSCRAVPRTILRGGFLPDRLVDLRLGLFALPAARLWESALRSGGPTSAHSSAGRGPCWWARWPPRCIRSWKSPRRCATAADAVQSRDSASRCCSARCSVSLTITTLNFYGASLTLLSVIDSLKPGRPTLAEAGSDVGHSRRWPCHRPCARLIAELRREVRRIPRRAAVPLHALDRDQPGRFLPGCARGHYSVREIFNPHGMYGRWNWRGLLRPMAVGFVAMIPFFSVPGLYVGPVAAALGGADIAMLVGLPVSAIVYLWACSSFDLEADRRRARSADAGLDVGGAAKA